jgi:membrane dipeptidase
MPIFDGHNDTLTHLYLPERGKGRSFFEESNIGQIDLPRAIKGGFAGGIFSIFTPTPKSSAEANDMYGFGFTKDGYKQTLRSPIDPQYAKNFTDAVVNLLYNLEASSKGKVGVVKTFSKLEDNLKRGILSAVLHFEGAEALKEDLTNLETYYEKGLRALGLVWSRPNAFGCGVHFEYPHTPDTGPGLTSAGKQLVKECNRLGILVDLAHVTEKGFWDVAKLSTAPLVVSHADAYSLCPSTRNLTDEQIDAVGKSGGIIGVNFEPFNTSFDGSLIGKLTMNKLIQEINDAPLSQIVKHIDYVVKRIGIDFVAFGSDFDGADMPKDLKDVTGLPKLIEELERSEYTDKDIEKITYKNWLRVLEQTWVK